MCCGLEPDATTSHALPRRHHGPDAPTPEPPLVPRRDRPRGCGRRLGRCRVDRRGPSSWPRRQRRGPAVVRGLGFRAAAADAPRAPDQRRADRGIPQPDQDAEPAAPRGHRDQRRRHRHRRPAGPRAAARPGPGSAPRHPGAAQGQHRHPRRRADHRGIVRPGRQPGPPRRRARRAPARRRRGRARQGEPVRVGQLPRVRARRRRRGRPVPQRLERRAAGSRATRTCWTRTRRAHRRDRPSPRPRT